MSRHLPVLVTLLAMTAVILPVGAAELPHDVTAFVARRDRCDHFRGEEADDPARQAAIAKALAETCHGTDAELTRLRRRHAEDAGVQQRLRGYDTNIEGTVARRGTGN